MKNNIHAGATPIKSRSSDTSKFTSFVFACLKQVDADPETSAQELRLAYVISQMLNNKTRVCFPLQLTLAKRMGVSDRAIREYIAGLVDRGHLRVRHRGRDNPSIYELILQDRNTASGHDTGRPEDTFRSCEEDRKSDVARPEISRRKTGTVLPTEPTSEPISEPEGRGAPQARLRSSLSGGETPTPVPAAMTESMLARALERAGWDTVSARLEFEKFRNTALSKRGLSHDWEAQWALWVERGVEHKAKRTEQQGLVIDQEGRPFPPPPPERRSHPGRKSNLQRGREMFGGSQ